MKEGNKNAFYLGLIVNNNIDLGLHHSMNALSLHEPARAVTLVVAAASAEKMVRLDGLFVIQNESLNFDPSEFVQKVSLMNVWICVSLLYDSKKFKV